ncbi:PDZ domain-containing protein [Acidobacteriota bacterium]
MKALMKHYVYQKYTRGGIAMKSLLSLLLTILCAGVAIQSLDAQMVIKRSGEDAGDIHFLKELAAVLAGGENGIDVMHVLPGDMRPKGYEDVDLQQQDKILMMNKKRIKSIEAFKEVYDSIEIDGQVKLGIRRGKEMMILSFKKADPEKLPAGQVKMQIGAQGEPGEGGGKVIKQTFTMGGEGGENMKPLAGTGLIVGEEEGRFKVMHKIEGMTDALKDVDIQQGDTIAAVNGETPDTLDKLVEIYGNIETGKEVRLGILRDGKKLEAKFTKPEAQRKMMFISR